MDSSGTEKKKVPLTVLRRGESGTVVSILPSHGGRGRGCGFVRRVMEMGLTPGTRITVVSSAPFHGPVEVVVRGSRLAVGRGVAERIIVEVE